MKLVITEICDDCDVERETELCDDCDHTFCADCMPTHDCESYLDANWE